MLETIPTAPFPDPVEPERALIAPTGLVPFVVIEEAVPMIQPASPDVSLDLTAPLPVVPIEAVQSAPETLDDKRRRMSGEIGAISLGSLGGAVRGLWRALTESHTDRAERYEAKAEELSFSKEVMAESSAAARDQRGSREILTGDPQYHPGPLVDLRPTSFAERRHDAVSWRAKDKARHHHDTSNDVADIFGRPGRDANGNYVKKDIGSPAYFARVEASRMRPRIKKAAIKAGHDYNNFHHKAGAKIGQLEEGATGGGRSIEAIDRQRAVYLELAARSREAAARKARRRTR